MPSGVYNHSNNKVWNRGLKGYKLVPCPKEKAERIRLSQLGVPRPQTSNDKNGNWKGDNCSYRSLHRWVERWLGKPMECKNCGKLKTTPRSIVWANISGNYLRELTDWISLCSGCHGLYDSFHRRNLI